MKEIKIFQSEIDDGVDELVKSTASVAYCSEATVHKGTFEAAKDVISKNCSRDKYYDAIIKLHPLSFWQRHRVRVLRSYPHSV